MDKNAKILIAGQDGLMERGLAAFLREQGFREVITSFERGVQLRDPVQVEELFAAQKPVFVYLFSVR